MKGKAIDRLVYDSLFPRAKPSDPQNFHAFLQKNLVIEVRQETQSFYGSLDSREAQYPGLDYSYPPHRTRLSRYPWHRRLFRTFDALGLTKHEIAGLTKWEGTRWAKERFEKEQGITIRDTTGDCIHDWVHPSLRGAASSASTSKHQQHQEAEVEDPEEVEEDEDEEEDTEDMDDEGEGSDIEMESVGVELNQRLRAAAAAREAGNATTVMDEEWEQWLKEAAEAGHLPYSGNESSSMLAELSRTSPAAAALHPRVLNAARLGQWHQIPEFLQNMVRQNVDQLRTVSRPETSPTSAHRQTSVPRPSRLREFVSGSDSTEPQPIPRHSGRLFGTLRRPVQSSHQAHAASALYGQGSASPPTQPTQPTQPPQS